MQFLNGYVSINFFAGYLSSRCPGFQQDQDMNRHLIVSRNVLSEERMRNLLPENSFLDCYLKLIDYAITHPSVFSFDEQVLLVDLVDATTKKIAYSDDKENNTQYESLMQKVCALAVKEASEVLPAKKYFWTKMAISAVAVVTILPALAAATFLFMTGSFACGGLATAATVYLGFLFDRMLSHLHHTHEKKNLYADFGRQAESLKQGSQTSFATFFAPLKKAASCSEADSLQITPSSGLLNKGM